MPPGGIVDTHVHIASDDRARFPVRPTGIGRTWWTTPGRDAEGLLRVMDANGVARALVLQPVGAYGYDNSYVLDVGARGDERLLAVPGVDVIDGSSERVRALSERPGVVGVRLFGIELGSPWADHIEPLLAACAEVDLVAVLTLIEPQLSKVTRALRAVPDARVALDHCGFPSLSAGRLPDDAPLLAFQEMPSVALKVSSHLLRECAAQGDPSALVAQLAECFGPDRLLWGSDFPQTDDDYAALLGLADAAARQLHADARVGFFGDNALRVFGQA
jgi:L-fuconolactonase